MKQKMQSYNLIALRFTIKHDCPVAGRFPLKYSLEEEETAAGEDTEEGDSHADETLVACD